jgi:arylsulfatase A
MQLEEMDTVHSDYRNGKLKPGAPEQQLYNTVNDPNQTRNVIREHPEVAERMEQLLREHQTMKKSLWK